MTVVTVNPNATSQTGLYWTLTGAATMHAALSDADDASYVQDGGGTIDEMSAYSPVIGFENPVGPAGSKIAGVRIRARVDDQSTGTRPVKHRARPYRDSHLGNGVTSAGLEAAPTDYTGGWETTRPGGGAWTQADLDALLVSLTRLDVYAGSNARTYRLWADVDYNEAPVVTPNTPTGLDTTRPTQTWSVADAEGDPQQSFRIKTFTAAQYGAAGFNAETATPAYDSGWVISPSMSHQVGVDLGNGVHRNYIQVRQPKVGGEEHPSAWAYVQFTVDVQGPAIPALTATPQHEQGRTELVVRSLDNFLTYTQSTAEDGVTGWNADLNAAAPVQESGLAALPGGSSLRMTALAAGDVRYATSDVAVVAGESLIARAKIQAGGVNEIQRVAITYTTAPTGGSFTLTFEGQTTAAIAWNANAAAVRAALEALPNVGVGDVLCTGGPLPGTPVDVEFAGALRDSDRTQMTATSSLTGGVLPAVVVSTTRPGVAPVGRQTRLAVRWKDAAGTTLRTDTSANLGLTVGGAFTEFTFTPPAPPAGAVKAALVPEIVGAGAAAEKHYGDHFGLQSSAATTWSRGGVMADPTAAFVIEHSLDGGATWEPTRLPVSERPDLLFGPTKAKTIHFREGPERLAVRFRARAQITLAGGVLAGEWTPGMIQATVISNRTWLKDLDDPTRDLSSSDDVVFGPIPHHQRKPQGVFDPLGRDTSVVVTEGTKAAEGRLEVWVLSTAARTALKTIVEADRTLLLQDIFGRQWYVELGQSDDIEQIVAKDLTGTFTVRDAHKVTYPWVEVAKP